MKLGTLVMVIAGVLPQTHEFPNTSTIGTFNTWTPSFMIVGGHRCPIEEHPYVVSIRITRSNRHICGGSIISKFWVLTAAHCAPRKYKRGTYKVVAGTSSRPPKPRSSETWRKQSPLVFRIYLHPDYNGIFLTDDVALMELEYPLKETKRVQFVKLPKGPPNASLQEICRDSTILGWGDQYSKNESMHPHTTPIPKHDPFLHCINIPVISREECEKRYNHKIPDTIICAYAKGKDACQGDSGGPLMCGGTQYGIVSSGLGCAHLHYPGLYARVDKYLDFIQHPRKISGARCPLFKYLYLLYCLCLFCHVLT